LIINVAVVVSSTNGNDVGVVSRCITNVVWILEIRRRLEDKNTIIGIDSEFVVIIGANESPGNGFVSGEGMNSGDIFSNGGAGCWITRITGRS